MHSLWHKNSSLSFIVFSTSFYFALIWHWYPLNLLETFTRWWVGIVCIQFCSILSLTNRILQNLVPINSLNIIIWCNSATFTESVLRRLQIMPVIMVDVLCRMVTIFLPSTIILFFCFSVPISVQNFLKLLKSFFYLCLFQHLRQATIFVVLFIRLSILLLILSL